MSETINIRVPGVVDLTQYRVQVGDTVAFIEKINATQSSLESWAQQLTWCATDMQSAADQIGIRHTEIVQTGMQVDSDKNAVQQLYTEAGQQRQLAETAATTASQQAVIAAAAADAASQAALVASAAEQSASEDAGVASQAATVSTQQRQLAEQAAQQAAQSAIEAGPTNLSFTRTATALTVHSSTGDDVELPAATSTEAGLMTAADKQALAGKQATLVSGTNIKTIDGQSLMGGGNINVAPTAAQLLAQYATAAFGAVGTYVFAQCSTTVNRGALYSGSQLLAAGFSAQYASISSGTSAYPSTEYIYFTRGSVGPSNPALSGTWRAMGETVSNVYGHVTLFLRVA